LSSTKKSSSLCLAAEASSVIKRGGTKTDEFSTSPYPDVAPAAFLLFMDGDLDLV
jgi:hypothetical protein